MRGRSLAAGLALGLAVAASAGLGAPKAGAAGTLRTATSTVDPVSVGVTAIAPLVLTADGTLQISGVLRNNGTTQLDKVVIQLRVADQPAGSRSELDASAASTAPPPGSVPSGALITEPDPLVAGGTLPWTLSVTARTLGLSTPGVYPLAIEVRADNPTTGGRTRYGTARTFLPWDLGTARPTRVAVVWPVLGTPSRGPDGKSLGAGLENELHGRLGSLLSAAGGTHLTWLLDGDTLESVRQLADSTIVKVTPTGTPTGTPTASAGASTGGSGSSGDSGGTGGTGGTGDTAGAAAAKAWLTALAAATATGQVLAVPFADPDLVASVRAGRTADLGVATTLGAQVVGQALASTPSVGSTPAEADVAWPADGTADSRTLTALAGLGSAAVILSDQLAAPVRAITTYTPSGVGPLTGTRLTAIVADNLLSTLIATPTAQQGGAALARQRFLAEIAMITAELPSAQRSLVIVPPRRWTPDATYVKGVLDALGQVPWAKPATIAELRTTAADGPARQRPTYPTAVQQREVSGRQLDSVRAAAAGLDSLSAVVADPTSLRDTYERAILRSESTVWRTQRAAGLVYAHSVETAVDDLVSAVHVVQSGGLTLAGRSGKIPVTVENRLSQAVTMNLSVAADPAVRLTLTQPGQEVIPPGQSRTFEVPAEATTNGSVQLIVQLVAPDGKPYGSAVTFPVQITGLGAVAQLVVGGAFVLLAVALVVRVARAVRRGRRPGSEASVRERVR